MCRSNTIPLHARATRERRKPVVLLPPLSCFLLLTLTSKNSSLTSSPQRSVIPCHPQLHPSGPDLPFPRSPPQLAGRPSDLPFPSPPTSPMASFCLAAIRQDHVTYSQFGTAMALMRACLPISQLDYLMCSRLGSPPTAKSKR
jgi:hypothetical protein